MKIGILTLPIAENYGGILQAVALYQLLEHLGHEVTLIYKPHDHNIIKKTAYLLTDSIPLSLLKKGEKLPIVNRLLSRAQRKARTKFHSVFIKNEITKISPLLPTFSKLKNYVSKNHFDALIVGSDQVWRREYIFDKHYQCYFLDFVNSSSTKKIAYAASFGKDYWEGINDHQEVESLLNSFNAISVREASGVSICKNTFNQEHVSHVLDPTLLHSKDFYKKIIKKHNCHIKDQPQILTYILDESLDKKTIINLVKNDLGLTNKSIKHLMGFNSKRTTTSVPEWLSNFQNSELIITDSFHGMVFSIIFEKQFIVIGNKSRGLDRFKSLLTLLNLENRLVFTLEDVKYLQTQPHINYEKINTRLDKLKSKSINFLIEALT